MVIDDAPSLPAPLFLKRRSPSATLLVPLVVLQPSPPPGSSLCIASPAKGFSSHDPEVTLLTPEFLVSKTSLSVGTSTHSRIRKTDFLSWFQVAYLIIVSVKYHNISLFEHIIK